MLAALVFVFCCYLIGSVPWSYLTGRWLFQLQLDDYGQGTVGPAKLLYLVGSDALFTAVLGEWLKGTMAAYLWSLWPGALPDTLLFFGLIALVAGHSWSPFIYWRGNDTYLPMLGFLMFWLPPLAQILLAIGLGCLLIFRSTRMASSVALVLTIFLGFYWSVSWPVLLALLTSLLFSRLQKLHGGKHQVQPVKI